MSAGVQSLCEADFAQCSPVILAGVLGLRLPVYTALRGSTDERSV